GLPRQWWLSGGGITTAMSPSTLGLGRLWRAKRAETVSQICDAGVLTMGDAAGRRWAAFPDSSHYVSDVAERLRQRGIGVTCGWFQTVVDGALQTVLSLRSDGSLDVGALCSSLGGGGHSRAAGCRLALESPLEAVRRVMEAAS